MAKNGVDLLSSSRGSAPAVGIDLGTTYSVVAVCRKGRTEIVANDSGSRTTPSIVAFQDGASYVGEAAKDLPADKQVYDAKRLIGRSYTDEKIQRDKLNWPFNVVDDNGAPRIEVDVGNGKREKFAPEEISAMVLRNLKETAEDFLGLEVTKAVVTVPAYFNERQRQSTKDACRIAGLEVLSMINEPTAAAVAYGLDKKSSTKKTVFIFDLGGGTFDVSVMTIDGTDFKVVASGGDTHLGGQDFDVRLVDHCLAEIKQKCGVDLRTANDRQALQDVRKACEMAKRKLSNAPEAVVSVFLPRYKVGERIAVTRAHFEALNADLFQKTMTLTEQVLAEAKVSRDAIDEVVLVGGSTRIPKVRSMLTAFFGGKGLRHSINPDEAVAYGAAVQAAVLSGDKFFDKLVTLKDVTPLSLGVATLGGLYSVIIPKNSTVPCKKMRTYHNPYGFEKQLKSSVYQGERPLVKDNHYLDKEFIIDVPPKPAGQVNVEITFEIDVSGLLTVTCVEPTTGRQVEVKISQKESHRSEQEIQDMMEKAKRFHKEDQDDLKQVEKTLREKRFF